MFDYDHILLFPNLNLIYAPLLQLATLTGHTFRVLYLAISPDGQVAFLLVCIVISQHFFTICGKQKRYQFVVFYLFFFFFIMYNFPLQTIVTGAGDETLRFWNVFPSPKSQVNKFFYFWYDVKYMWFLVSLECSLFSGHQFLDQIKMSYSQTKSIATTELSWTFFFILNDIFAHDVKLYDTHMFVWHLVLGILIERTCSVFDFIVNSNSHMGLNYKLQNTDSEIGASFLGRTTIR